MLDKFKEELIKKATENNDLKYTEKPNDFVSAINILRNDNFIRYIKKIDSDVLIRNEQINGMLKLHKDNPNLTLSKLLSESNNNFLNDKKYINIIITLMNLVYVQQYREKIIDDAWFLQHKIASATVGNITSFKSINAIQECNSSNSINFRELMYYDLYETEEKPFDEVFEDKNNLLFILEDTKTAFIYTFDMFKSEDIQEFVLECTREVLGVPTLYEISNQYKWYNQISSPYNIGVSTSQLYEALSLYENSNYDIRKFIISNPRKVDYITNIKAITWHRSGINIWNDYINIVSNTHCNIGMTFYDKICFVE